MDIHHEMIIHNTPERVYEALTKIGDLEVWMGHPVMGRLEVGGVIEIQFHRGTMKLEIVGLEAGRLVQWRVIEGMETKDQIMACPCPAQMCDVESRCGIRSPCECSQE